MKKRALSHEKTIRYEHYVREKATVVQMESISMPMQCVYLMGGTE